MATQRVKKPKEKKEAKAQFWVTPTERKKFNRNAKKSGMSLTDYFVEKCC